MSIFTGFFTGFRRRAATGAAILASVVAQEGLARPQEQKPAFSTSTNTKSSAPASLGNFRYVQDAQSHFIAAEHLNSASDYTKYEVKGDKFTATMATPQGETVKISGTVEHGKDGSWKVKSTDNLHYERSSDQLVEDTKDMQHLQGREKILADQLTNNLPAVLQGAKNVTPSDSKINVIVDDIKNPKTIWVQQGDWFHVITATKKDVFDLEGHDASGHKVSGKGALNDTKLEIQSLKGTGPNGLTETFDPKKEAKAYESKNHAGTKITSPEAPLESPTGRGNIALQAAFTTLTEISQLTAAPAAAATPIQAPPPAALNPAPAADGKPPAATPEQLPEGLRTQPAQEATAPATPPNPAKVDEWKKGSDFVKVTDGDSIIRVDDVNRTVIVTNLSQDYQVTLKLNGDGKLSDVLEQNHLVEQTGGTYSGTEIAHVEGGNYYRPNQPRVDWFGEEGWVSRAVKGGTPSGNKPDYLPSDVQRRMQKLAPKISEALAATHDYPAANPGAIALNENQKFNGLQAIGVTLPAAEKLNERTPARKLQAPKQP